MPNKLTPAASAEAFSDAYDAVNQSTPERCQPCGPARINAFVLAQAVASGSIRLVDAATQQRKAIDDGCWLGSANVATCDGMKTACGYGGRPLDESGK